MSDPRNRVGDSTARSEAHSAVDHEGPTLVSPAALARGHEPDQLTDKPVWYFFGALMIGAVLTFGLIVPALFSVFGPSPGNAMAPGRNRNPISIDKRLEALSQGGKQPRLDGLDIPRTVLPKDEELDKAGRADLRSYQPEQGPTNSPDYHPEDLWPERNYLLNRVVEKDGKAQVPPAAVYAKLLEGDKKLKVREKAEKLPIVDSGIATRGKESSAGNPPPPEEKPHDKGDHH